jgi:hypothetical protein
MAIQVQGNLGVVAEVDGTTFRAIRVTPRPLEALGHYELELTTGGYGGLAVGTPLFSMRWTDATRLCVISNCRVSVQTTSPFTISQVTSRELVIARSWTVSDTGGAAVVLTGSALKKRTSAASTLFATGDIRFHSGAIVPGTRVVEANVIGQALGFSIGGFEARLGMDIDRTDLLLDSGGHDHPIVLAQNEGVIVQVGTLLGTGGAQKTTVKIAWAEVAAY